MYDKLCGTLRELNALEGISGLLGWDEMGEQWLIPPLTDQWRAKIRAVTALAAVHIRVACFFTRARVTP